MTCASCVGRVEEGAHPRRRGGRGLGQPRHRDRHRHLRPGLHLPDDLTAAVAKSGYTAAHGTTPATRRRHERRRRADRRRTRLDAVDDLDARRDTEIAHLKRRWQVALTTGLALMGVMYLPLHLDTMDWLMPLILVIATGVQLWAGADIYRQAWTAAKHRATTMDTLVALGTGVAYGYSAFVTLWPGPGPVAGACRCTCTSRPRSSWSPSS